MRKKHFLLLSISIILICIFFRYFMFKGDIDSNDLILTSLEMTSANINPSRLQIGKMILNKPILHECTLSNIGNKPLLIEHIGVDCNCTVVEWDRGKPIAPDSFVILSVKVIPDNIGYFHKKITIFCNVENNPLFIYVKGNVNQK